MCISFVFALFSFCCFGNISVIVFSFFYLLVFLFIIYLFIFANFAIFYSQLFKEYLNEESKRALEQKKIDAEFALRETQQANEYTLASKKLDLESQERRSRANAEIMAKFLNDRQPSTVGVCHPP